MFTPYSPEWPKQYEAESRVVQDILGDIVLDMQHVGNTSIPGSTGRPVIDIAILINSIDDLKPYLPQIEALGYTHIPWPSLTGRMFFGRGNPETHHLTFVQKDKQSYFKKQIIFRDYLRAHPKYVKEYVDVKVSALEKVTDASRYVQIKAPFIEKILELAHALN
ncbi:GrpB family protein [Candidatus Nomurabacteria bacterium]|nr:GrpB family protein [Candidatus Nomurabacteria bacterium]